MKDDYTTNSRALDLIARGDTVGVFQLESAGMQDICRRLGVTCFEQVIAIISLYRPGPLQYIPSYIARARGEEGVTYLHPELEPILRETYGLIVYQEQVMQVSQVVAGFSPGEADILRKAMGKKKPEVMAKQYESWVQGCREAGRLTPEQAIQLWSELEEFAQYSFNKSHATAYAMLALQTAYLKAHWPREFMGSCMNQEAGNAEKLGVLIREAQKMGITLVQPDVRLSQVGMWPCEEGLRFGLSMIHGVGEKAATSILEARSQGQFTSLFDFVKRAKADSKVIEALASTGALDWTGESRAQVVAQKEYIEKRVTADREAEEKYRTDTLFDIDEQAMPLERAEDVPEWTPVQILQRERKHLGIYLSGHPIKNLREQLDNVQDTTILEVEGTEVGADICICGLVCSKKVKPIQNGDMWILTLEDELGSTVDSIFWSKCQGTYPWVEEGLVVAIHGRVSQKGDYPKNIIANRVEKFEV